MKQRPKFLQQIVMITLVTVFCANVTSLQFVSAQTNDESRWDDAPALVNPALGNPLEQSFNKTDTLTNGSKPRISAGQSQFRDSNLRDKTAKPLSANNGGNSIVQTSTANGTNPSNVADAANVWANANDETAANDTFAWQGNMSPPNNATENSNIITTPYASPQQTFSGDNSVNSLAMQNALLQQQAFIQQQQALQQQAIQQNGMNSLAAYPLPAASPLDPNYAYPQAPYPNLFTPPVMPPYANQYPSQYPTPYPYSQYAYPYGQPQMPMGAPYDYIQQQQYMTAMRQEELRQNEMNGAARENRNGLPPPQQSSANGGKTNPDGTDDTNKSWSMNDLLPLKVSSPLAETLWTGAGYLSPFAGADAPDRGVGQPLRMRSWTDRPYYIGAFIGYVGGSELMNGNVTISGGTPTTVSAKIKQDGGGMGGL
ncbi:MAG: hypothetical protein LBU65_05730, partial [Planctomycetaceae bacterium]|nr:hypothetical protein [Planctomycetaceae bacterium]